MREYQIGQIVLSKAGRDKAGLFVILQIEDEYVYLVDGKIRKMDNPKRKKKKHIQAVNYVDATLSARIIDDQKIVNADIRKAIQLFETEKTRVEV